MGAVPVATAGDVGAPTGLPLAVFGRAAGVGGGLVGTFGRSPVGVGGGDGGFVVIFGEGGRVTIFGDGERVTGGGLGGGESFVSTITFSSALRASDPGGGGGTVRGFLRAGSAWAATSIDDVGVDGVGAGAGGAGAGSGAGSTVQPDAKLSIRFLVASPSRRRVRSSSGTRSQ